MKESYFAKLLRKIILYLILKFMCIISTKFIHTTVDLPFQEKKKWEISWSIKEKLKGLVDSVKPILTCKDFMTKSFMISETLRNDKNQCEKDQWLKVSIQR